MKNNWRIIKIDETSFWDHGNQNILSKIGRIFGVYVYDANKHVHCCEFTPSYELNFVHSQFEGCADFNDLPGEQIEQCDDYIRDGDRYSDLVRYYHTHSILAERSHLIKPGCLPGRNRTYGWMRLGRIARSQSVESIIDAVREHYI